MNEKQEKKVSRNIALALGIICIILAIGVVGAIADYTSIINGKDNNITTLTNQNNQLQTWLSRNISAYTNYYKIANLNTSIVWVNDQTVSQPAGGGGISYTSWSESASYAGRISITVFSSTTSKTYANVVYSGWGVNYNNAIVVGTSGTAYFPVLPSYNVTVEVGNGNLADGATETVTITYYY